MIWLLEEQLAYALAKSVGDDRVMQQAEAHARWRYWATISLFTFAGYLLTTRMTLP